MDVYNDPFGDNLENRGKYYPQVVLTFKKLLLDDSHCDFTIKIGSESIHAHASVICCRCEEIIGFPNPDEKSKKKTKRLEIKINPNSVNAAAMSKILEFLYTGMVDFPKLADKEILFLVKAARHFKLDRLSYLCERWLNEHMTIESVFHLLKAATDLEEDRIKGFCLQFALKHYNDFIANKDGIYILGIELFQEVVAAFQTNPAPPASIYPEGGPPDTLLEDFKKLYDRMPYSDLNVTCGPENIKCHKAILTAFSDSLANNLVKDDTPQNISATAFKSLLQFCYFGHGEVDAKPACELVAFCRRNKLATLLRICEDKIRNSINADTVLDILGVSYLPADGKQDLVDELQAKCFPFILEHLDQVNLSMAKAFNPLMTIDLLLQLQSSCKQNKYGLGCILNVSGGGSGVAKSSGPPSKKPPAKKPPAKTPPSQLPPPNSLGKAPSGGSGVKSPPGAPPRRNQPPPPSNVVAGVKVPPVNDSRPPPPPRNEKNLPPPVIGTPPTRTTSGSGSNFPPPTLTNSTSVRDVKQDDSKGRLSRRKSQKDVKTDIKPKLSRKDKKEEERRKKEEKKRIEKERKERQKMEKKFKGKGGDIF